MAPTFLAIVAVVLNAVSILAALEGRWRVAFMLQTIACSSLWIAVAR